MFHPGLLACGADPEPDASREDDAGAEIDYSGVFRYQTILFEGCGRPSCVPLQPWKVKVALERDTSPGYTDVRDRQLQGH